MSWIEVALRCTFAVTVTLCLLYLAEMSVPSGALIVFLLSMSIAATWVLINLLQDKDLLRDLFD